MAGTFCPKCGTQAASGDRFCKACGTQLDAKLTPEAAAATSSTTAPPSPASSDESRSRRSRAWLISMAVVVAILALAAAVVAVEQSGSDGTAADAPDATDAPDAGDAGDAVEDSGPDRTTRRVGQAATDNDLSFKVVEFDEAKALPASEEASEPPRASKGAKIVGARVEIKNNGSTKVDPYCGGGGAVLLDEEGNNYEPISEVFGVKGNDSVCGDGISPGFRDTLTLPFEIPSDVEIGGLVLWNPEVEEDSDGEVDDLLFEP